mmetsp:Transcript_73593/g.204511  ORF Transcript_73593/g.204511 Transcript_73593/m.204511 type:complete len:226 (+) Transcript_73593:87-764(+)
MPGSVPRKAVPHDHANKQHRGQLQVLRVQKWHSCVDLMNGIRRTQDKPLVGGEHEVEDRVRVAAEGVRDEYRRRGREEAIGDERVDPVAMEERRHEVDEDHHQQAMPAPGRPSLARICGSTIAHVAEVLPKPIDVEQAETGNHEAIPEDAGQGHGPHRGDEQNECLVQDPPRVVHGVNLLLQPRHLDVVHHRERHVQELPHDADPNVDRGLRMQEHVAGARQQRR